MSATHTAVHRPAHALRRIAWLASALFWSTFAVLELVNHGWLSGVLALAFFIGPDLAMLVGARDARHTAHGQLPPRAVPSYNALHRAAVPLALLVLYAAQPWFSWAPLLASLCGWLAHISYDRVFGYGLRTREGFQRD